MYIRGPSPNAASRRRMAMYRNVIAALHEPAGDEVENVVEEAMQILCRIGAVSTGDQVILTMGSRMGSQGGTNTLRLIRMDRGEELDQKTKPDFSQIGM